MKFLVDEDMPRSLAPALRAAGYEAHDVRDIGLSGSSDDQVFAHAVSSGLALLSEDLGFANIHTFPLGSHAGIVIGRFPSTTPTTEVNRAIVDALATLTDADIGGSLVIIEPTRVRLRSATP